MSFPLFKIPTGAFPVPEAVPFDQLPPGVLQALMRLAEGPPKPAVTPAVMNQAELSMIAPFLPFRSYR